MSQHDVARLLQCGREDGVLIAGSLKLTNLFQEGRRRAWPNLCLKFSQGVQAGVALGSGKSGVEGDDASARFGQTFDQPGI